MHHVLFLWPGMTAYWSAAFAALAAAEQVEAVTVLHGPVDGHAPYDLALLRPPGVEVVVIPQPWSRAVLDALVDRTRPTIIVAGPRSRAVLGCLHRAGRQGARRIVWTDFSWQGTPQQRLLGLAGRLGRRWAYDAAYVPSQVSAGYVHRLGFPRAAIAECAIPVDAGRLAGVPPPTGHRLLFVGRLVAEKAPDVLAQAYAAARSAVAQPWPLDVVGTGPDDGGLAATPGVTLHGFVQPDALPALLAGAGALVLPSRFDCWGMAPVEAACTGRPVVVSEGCGVASEVREAGAGLVVPAGSVAALTTALVTMMSATDGQRTAWGEAGAAWAATYAPEPWVARLLELAAR